MFKVYTSKQLKDKELAEFRAKHLVATYKRGDRVCHLVVFS